VIDSIPPKSYKKKNRGERERKRQRRKEEEEDQIKSLSSSLITIYFSDYINEEQKKPEI
jgi:hypothetical protein